MTEKFKGTLTVYQNGQTLITPKKGTLEITRKASGKMFGWTVESAAKLGAKETALARRLAATWEYLAVEFVTAEGLRYFGQSRVTALLPISGAFRLELFSELEINSTPKAEDTPV